MTSLPIWKPSEDESHRLISAGYDGLYFPDECACLASDLYPCGERQLECRPGYLLECDCGDHDWHVGEKEIRGDLK